MSESTSTPDIGQDEFTPEEQFLLDSYRSASEDGREVLRSLSRAILKGHQRPGWDTLAIEDMARTIPANGLTEDQLLRLTSGASTVLERNTPERLSDRAYVRRSLLPELGHPTLDGVIGDCVIRQTDGLHQARLFTGGYEVTPASLHELQVGVPELSLRPGWFVLLRHATTWPNDKPLELTPETIVCAWTGWDHGVHLLSYADYCKRVPLAYQQPMAISELLAAFEPVPIGTEPLPVEFAPLPTLRRWTSEPENEGFDIYQHGPDGERRRFSQRTDGGGLIAGGVFTLDALDREANDEDIVQTSADGTVTTWGALKRRFKSAGRRQYDTVLLQTFRRVL